MSWLPSGGHPQVTTSKWFPEGGHVAVTVGLGCTTEGDRPRVIRKVTHVSSPSVSPSRSVRRPRPTRVSLAGVVLVASVLVGACQGNGGTSTPSVSSPPLRAPTTSATSASAPVVARDKAIAAYRGMWAAYQKAAETANPDDPDLATYATDGALRTLTTGLKSIKDRGLVARGEIVVSPRVTAVEPANKPATIEITDCADTTNSLLYRKSGGLYNDKPGGRRLIIATVKDIGGGVWKVVSFGARDIGTC
jgi:hypothetical protein